MTAAADALKRMACVNFVNFAGAVTVEELTSRSWASITMTGERHRMILRLEGPGAGIAASSFRSGLEEREFDLGGHILADIVMVDMREDGEDRVRLTLEALTVES